MHAGLHRCQDMAFASGFARSCPVPGARPGDYLHRVVPMPGGHILAGIRFEAGDLERPFVEVLAWDHDLLAPDGWPAAVRAVADEFALFSPRRLRVLLPAGREPPVAPAAEPDMLLVAGRLAELQEQPAPDSETADTGLVAERATGLAFMREYEQSMEAFRATAGALAQAVWPTSAEDFRRCISDGAVVVMRQGGTWVGVAAAVRDAEWLLDGYLVMEELLDAPFRGRGLGRSLQRHLIHALPRSDAPLFGTIHHLNGASLATARRCGRVVVATYWFVELPQ